MFVYWLKQRRPGGQDSQSNDRGPGHHARRRQPLYEAVVADAQRIHQHPGLAVGHALGGHEDGELIAGRDRARIGQHGQAAALARHGLDRARRQEQGRRSDAPPQTM